MILIGDILNNLYGLFGLGILIGIVAAAFLLNVLFMFMGVKQVKGKELSFGSIFVTTLLSFVCTAIPCGCFLSAYIISTRHKVTYGKGLLAWIIALIIPIIAVIIIVLIFVFFTIGIADFLQMFGF